jgi:hypothetical protein
MRQVTTPDFCRVCTEGLWRALARRVDFVDTVRTFCTGASRRAIELELVPLAHLRKHNGAGAKANAEKYEVRWHKDGKAVPEWDDATRVEVTDSGGMAAETYRVEVRFSTEEVRKDDEGYLTSAHTFTVSEQCS